MLFNYITIRSITIKEHSNILKVICKTLIFLKLVSKTKTKIQNVELGCIPVTNRIRAIILYFYEFFGNFKRCVCYLVTKHGF